MCLIALAFDTDPRYAFVLAANRDERHTRPSAQAGWWEDMPNVLGGRDLVAGGTWLAVDRRGRLAAVTNFRDPGSPPAPQSRGKLVTEFLSGTLTADEFLETLDAQRGEYGPFNLVLLDRTGCRYYSNRASAAILEPGVHALSNAALGDGWPKTAAARAGLESWLRTDAPPEALLDLLADRGPDGTLAERYRRSLFIEADDYGTRSSTVVALERSGRLTFIERAFAPRGVPLGMVRESFAIDREPLRATAR